MNAVLRLKMEGKYGGRTTRLQKPQKKPYFDSVTISKLLFRCLLQPGMRSPDIQLCPLQVVYGKIPTQKIVTTTHTEYIVHAKIHIK